MKKTTKIIANILMLCTLASFGSIANAAEKLLIPLGKSISIPSYGVKKILAVKDNVVDVLNVSDSEIIISGVGDSANSTQLILWDKRGKRVYDVETFSETEVIQQKFRAIIDNENISLKIFPDSAYIQGMATSMEEKDRAEKVAKSLVGKKQLISLITFESSVTSLQSRIEAAINEPDVRVTVISPKIDPNETSAKNIIKNVIATDSAGIRVILQGSVKNQNDYINMTEVVKGFVSDVNQISNLVNISDPYQVVFQAYILQVTKKNTNDLGITWGGENLGAGQLGFIEIPGISQTVGDFPGGGDGLAKMPSKMNPLYMKNINRFSRIAALVKAWEDSGKAKVISKPNLLVYASAIPQPNYYSKAESSWQGEAGTGGNPESDKGLAFVDVGQTVQVEKDAGNGKTSYEPFEAKLRLCIRDLYIDGDNLKFSVYAQQEELSFERGNGASPDKHSRDIMTTVRIKDEQTIALGGLISKNNSVSWGGVPGLSRLPGIGRLFRHRSVSTSENELIILLTPKISNKDRDLMGNKVFETINVPRRSEKLENLDKIFNQIKSSHIPSKIK